jgi:succinate dehydrogenase / fumarate reductase, membrane anchor subunit
MVERKIVGAHYGLRDWLAQRITAIVMALYRLLLLVLLICAPKLDFTSWHLVFAPQWMKLATLLFLLSVYFHAWVGMRNIIMDYIKCSGLRLALYVLVIAALIVYAGWSVQILWSV